MMISTEELEFEILGCRVKFSPRAEGQVDPREVVEFVQDEAIKIKNNTLSRSDSEIAVLLALKLASDKLSLESEYRVNIEKLESSVYDALQFVEQVSSTSV